LPVTATSPLALVVDQLRTSVSNSAEFQTRTGAANAAAALAFIYLDVVSNDAGMSAKRPFALIKVSQIGSNQISDGTAIDLSVGGDLVLILEDDATNQTVHDDSFLDFLNFSDEVMQDLRLASGVEGEFPFYEEQLVWAPSRTRRAERDSSNNDYWVSAYQLSWGDFE